MQNRIDDTVLTMLLFEATSVSATILKGTHKQGAKRWFSVWWQSGINLWRELQLEIKQVKFAENHKEVSEIAQEIYDDNAAFIYECARILVDIKQEDRNKVVKELNNYLNEKV